MIRFDGMSPASNANVRWWRRGQYVFEPEALLSLFRLGVFLIVAGFVSAAGIAAKHGFWGSSVLFSGEPWEICQPQLERREEKYRENAELLRIYRLRRESFVDGQVNVNSTLYVDAPDNLKKEEDRIKALELNRDSLRVESLSSSMRWLIPGLALIIFVAFVAGRLILWHAAIVFPASTQVKLSKWKKPYWLWVLLPFAIHEAREITTSVLTVDKSWFGWSSFCICTSAWLLQWIVAFGAYMVIGYPACIIWCMSKMEYRPTLLVRDANDGAWGVGGYVGFLHTWSILVLLSLFVPSVFFLVAIARYLSLLYLIPTGALVAGASLVVGRLVWQAIQIRLAYSRELSLLGTWTQIQSLKPPGDPTTPFLGERWWNLPATIIAALGTLWAFMEWSGIVGILTRLVSRSG